MAENSSISWTDHTMNFWIGCTEVSPACDNCYARAYGHRFGVKWGADEDRRKTAKSTWKKAFAWDKAAAAKGIRSRVFSNSLSDFFDIEVADEWRTEAMEIVRATPNLDWMILTKRAKKALEWSRQHPLPGNVWMGVTAENQRMADMRLKYLVRIEAAKRFVSAEPLLDEIDISYYLPSIDLVIGGGESGPNARPTSLVWARYLRDQCIGEETCFHWKQWGEWAPGLNFADGIPSGRSSDFGEVGMRDDMRSWHVGRGLAGRLLDGVEWNGMPA